MTLLEARLHGRLAETIFFPPSIHPDLRPMLNPEFLRKRKRIEESAITSPKKARIAQSPTAFREEGFGDGGFGDHGFGEGVFGDTGFDSGFGDVDVQPESPGRSPSLMDDDAQNVLEEEEPPTSISGNMSHSTIAAVQLLQKELSSNRTATLTQLSTKAAPNGVRREDAVKMFFECLVLASRDVIRVAQTSGFGEIRVSGKEGLFQIGSSQQVLV